MTIEKDNLLKSDSYDTFKGNQFKSWSGIRLWVLQGFNLYFFLTIKHLSLPSILLLLFCSLFWFFLISYHLHYFQVSDQHLLIRSHILFWRKKIYNISDIEELAFERRGNLPNCLRVITKDFSNKLYPAGTLNNKAWLTLKSKLETFGITVRNDCI